jgi:hypothetical protein
VEENLDKAKYVGRPFDYVMDTAELKANDIHRHFVDEANESLVLVIGM